MTITKKQFTINNESWYADQVSPLHGAVEEIVVGLCSYRDDGKSDRWTHEFIIRFYQVQKEIHPRVEMFDDSWKAFTHPLFKELFIMLAETSNCYAYTLKEVKKSIINVLLECGFEDNTSRTKE